MRELKYLLSCFGLTSTDIEAITPNFSHKHLIKGDFFSVEGSANQNLAYIENGSFQYFHSRDWREITTNVIGKQGFIVSLHSVLRQKPAQENIRAITDVDIWIIHKNAFDKLQK